MEGITLSQQTADSQKVPGGIIKLKVLSFKVIYSDQNK